MVNILGVFGLIVLFFVYFGDSCTRSSSRDYKPKKPVRTYTSENSSRTAHQSRPASVCMDRLNDGSWRLKNIDTNDYGDTWQVVLWKKPSGYITCIVDKQTNHILRTY